MVWDMESTFKTSLESGWYIRSKFDTEPAEWLRMLSKDEAFKYIQTCQDKDLFLMFVATDGLAMNISF